MHRTLLLTTLLGALAAAPAQAGTKVYSKIKLSFWGVTVGDMQSVVTVDGARYAIGGKVDTTGIAKVLAPTKASFNSSGAVAGRQVVPAAHKLDYAQRRKRGSVRMDFRNGNVVKAISNPKPKPRADRVPVKPVHLKKVLDPVSSLVFAVKPGEVGRGASVCARTLPIYDGVNRADLVLSHKRTRTTRVKGFRGKVHTCAVRYRPVAGHRTSRKSTREFAANRSMEISVAQVGDTPVYALFGFKVRTARGTASGEATTFQLQ